MIRRILLVILFLVISLVAGTEITAEQGTNAKTQNTGINPKTLCKKVATMVKSEKIKKYEADFKYVFGKNEVLLGLEYYNLDIDGDGKTDKVKCDNSGSGGSYLMVKLSGGGGYDIEENGFVTILKLDGRVYELITYYGNDRNPDGSIKRKIVGRSLYMLTKQGQIMTCEF